MPGSPVDSLRLVGHVFSVSGSQANIRLTGLVRSELPDDRRITVGKFLAMRTLRSSVKQQHDRVLARGVEARRLNQPVLNLLTGRGRHGQAFRL